jgi:6-phospho-3-hexuloisomerase
MIDIPALATRAAAEISTAAAGVDAPAFGALVEALATARRIACFGVGREGLMMRALAMRLYHLGCDAHVVGDMSCPPLGPGDLLVASAGPGTFSTVNALIGVARAAGAHVACVTAQPDGPAPRAADLVLVIPAQTMANDRTNNVALLPMGSVYEGAQYLVFELLVLALRDRLSVHPDTMRQRHTNLE